MKFFFPGLWLILLLASGPLVPGWAEAESPKELRPFIQKHCLDCHDSETTKGGLDLEQLGFDPDDPANFENWVKVVDRVRDGEMPPSVKKRPPPKEITRFVRGLSNHLLEVEQKKIATEGRSTQRRLNRYEYENALRDLLHAPWLEIKDSLPEDGEAYRFNKVGDSLDVSHVQMARYLAAAESALRQVMVRQSNRPSSKTVRYYAREQRRFVGPMKFSEFNMAPERATFPVLGTAAQPEVRRGNAPITVGSANPEERELEGMGVVASAYEPIEPGFDRFKASHSGRYRLRFCALSIWVAPSPGKNWFVPDFDNLSEGRRSEPVTIYGERPPRQLRRLGNFDVTPQADIQELEVHLIEGESIRPDASRLFRSRPGKHRWQNPLAEPDGQPGVVFRWLEVEGPLFEEWPPKGHQLLFGDLEIKEPFFSRGTATVVSHQPREDAARLLKNFMAHTYRRPLGEGEAGRFLPLVELALEKGADFGEAMITAYKAVLCSPEFLYLEERPGRLDDHALASRLSFFLWNSPPDQTLRELAAQGRLRKPAILRAQTERLLKDPKSRRFVEAFLDYWLGLRHAFDNAPDEFLYPDYYLDDLLGESAVEETRAFFAELIRNDLPARNLVASDFSMLNERLAVHYGLPPFEGVALRRVPLPSESPRGGLMTQASVLKVTANGTTTTPVVRGAWVMERLLGKPIPPPPPSIPAIEPDIRGAVTIRQQLEKHRSDASCNACHARFDPAGFALESFDVMGGWRENYRAQGNGKPVEGLGKNGQRFAFVNGPAVDPSGVLPDGRSFSDVREFKELILQDEAQIARNLARQLTVYATGAPVLFSDREKIEELLVRTRRKDFGVRSLIHELVQSDLFQWK